MIRITAIALTLFIGSTSLDAEEWIPPEMCCPSAGDCRPLENDELIRFVDRDGRLGWLVNTEKVTEFVPDGHSKLHEIPSKVEYPQSICLRDPSEFNETGPHKVSEELILKCLLVRRTMF